MWQPSPAGIKIALANTALLAAFQPSLPDWRPTDVAGSPYCIRGYIVDDHLGGPDGLAAARNRPGRRPFLAVTRSCRYRYLHTDGALERQTHHQDKRGCPMIDDPSHGASR